MISPGAVKAIGFDFDHTLGIDNKLERVAFLRLLEQACKAGAHCFGTLAEEIERIDRVLAQQRSGACTIEEAVGAFVSERGACEPESYVGEYKRLAMDMVDAFVIPQPGVREMLAELRSRGIPCAILTNGWSPLQQCKAARVHFDGPILVSADIRTQKPDRRAFAELARVLAVPSECVAYVGDAPASDVDGALAAGMHGIWFDAEGAAYPADLRAPSSVIHSLAELPALL